MSSDWISDRFPSYFLDEQTVLKFLKEKFGDSGTKDSDFDVQVVRPLFSLFALY